MKGIGDVGHDPFIVEGWIDQIDGRGAVGLSNINLIIEGRHHVFNLLPDLVIEGGGVGVVGVVKEDSC